ncbi:PBS lyase HEAT-like repeat domain protein [Gloeomargarita lithophora Alchichica-D10]|uniref:PBS lyase HEAT-like repeat domain protein n=1 Tax=Gloeomargarita lithophora Alchichica-D10 TaxID=1188229 RepID=A0A1J0AAG0_9CYAN|nr:HEAT repeat domain-containing protein [Gloeomargarita lithophora]APB32893.1 PBS lyase HEAT-like repeat domain protein [Gloeomargarita lithophora Alchichica-D10]
MFTDDQPDLASPLDDWQEAPQPDPDLMLAQLTASEPLQRMQAARAFCELQDERAGERLIPLLADACPLVRLSAAYALGRNPTPLAVPALIQQWHHDANGYVRKGIIWALGYSRDHQAAPTLIMALQRDIPAVRLWAASSLVQLMQGNGQLLPLAVQVLCHTLQQDPVAAVRSNCTWALGQIPPEHLSEDLYLQIVEALRGGLQDGDAGVRDDSWSALLNLGVIAGLPTPDELAL